MYLVRDIPNYITKMVHKKCSWLMRGKTTRCQKGAVGDYCARQNHQIKHGAQPFHPCRACGAGCRVEHRLCKACVGVALTHRLDRLEERTRKAFKDVLNDLSPQGHPNHSSGVCARAPTSWWRWDSRHERVVDVRAHILEHPGGAKSQLPQRQQQFLEKGFNNDTILSLAGPYAQHPQYYLQF